MEYKQQLEPVLEEIVLKWEIPGLAVGIVQDGVVAYQGMFGVQNLATGASVTEKSLFCTASVSKSFTAVAVMQLAERGLVNLDAPVVDVLPYFKMADSRFEQVTIRHALSHTSGIPDMDEMAYIDFWQHPDSDLGEPEGYVRSLTVQGLDFDPGDKFSYSNTAYNVLGALVAEVSGMSFEAYLRQQVLEPAGMGTSTFNFEEIPGDLLAPPHLRLPEMTVTPIYPYHRSDSPSSNLHASLQDMCGWCLTCLQQGELGVLLSPASFQTMWSPVVQRGWPPLYEHMCLGWNAGSFQGLKTISHGGAGPGMNAFLLLMPEAGKGAVLLCNTESQAHYNLIDALLDALLGRKPQVSEVDWMVPVCHALAKGGREAAFECCEQLKAADPVPVVFDQDSLVGVVYQMALAGLYRPALDLMDLTLQEYPEFSYAYFLRAQIRLVLGEIGPAKADLQQALEIDPDYKAAARLVEKTY